MQGGFFTALIDSDSSVAKFVHPPGLTSINVLDFSPTKHVNFEASIHFPVDDGVVQVETFGISVNSDGTVYYGMQVMIYIFVMNMTIFLASISYYCLVGSYNG